MARNLTSVLALLLCLGLPALAGAAATAAPPAADAPPAVAASPDCGAGANALTGPMCSENLSADSGAGRDERHLEAIQVVLEEHTEQTPEEICEEVCACSEVVYWTKISVPPYPCIVTCYCRPCEQ